MPLENFCLRRRFLKVDGSAVFMLKMSPLQLADAFGDRQQQCRFRNGGYNGNESIWSDVDFEDLLVVVWLFIDSFED